MKYETKSAQYYNYFEDAKLIEIDDDNKKLAIVLNGKEKIVDIFDAAPYVDYNPFENYIKEILQKEKKINDKQSGVIYIQEESNYLDANKIFQENSLNNSKNSLVEKNNIYMPKNQQNNQVKNNILKMPKIFSKSEEKSRKNKNKINAFKEIGKYTGLSTTKFQIYYLSPNINYKNIKINVKKPKIKHKLLSVIQLIDDSILGIKWFRFIRTDTINDENLSVNQKYIKKSKLLLVVGEGGLISVYQLESYNAFNNIRVNMTINGLQTQPFTNFKEKYIQIASYKLGNPIIDFHLLDKPYINIDLSEIRLITLHIDNTFTFWKILYENEQIKLQVHYNFELPKFVCENFLMDSNEEYLICFNKTGIMIFFAKYQSIPLPIIYRYSYSEYVPPLKELKKLTYSNEILSENNDKINNKEKKIENSNKKKDKKGEKKIKQIPYKEKNQDKKKNKNKNDDDALFIIKEDKDYEEEEEFEENIENENEEDGKDEYDDFFNEDNPNFINNDKDIYLEDDQYLKFLQKPCFLDFETKFLFVKNNIKKYEYTLYCFNFMKLYKVEKDIDFLALCLNEYDDILISKVYSSKEKIYFSESPFAYFHPVKEDSIDNNILLEKENREILKEIKFDVDIIVENLYEGLFIREGDNIIIIKLPVKNEIDLNIINDDIRLSKFIFYEQPTLENLKSNCLAKWTVNNTLIVHSVNSLFNIIKFRKEAIVLGIPISKSKLIEFVNLNFSE